MTGIDWKALLLGVAVLAPLGAANAQDPAPGPRFDGPLAKKHSRYADLRRSADEAGDRSQQVLRDLVLIRTLDRLGDLDEERKHIVSKKPPPRARLHAQIVRVGDAKDDEEQVFLAKLPRKERRHAELRRFRDFAGDQQELARYKDDKIRFGNLNDKIGFAEDRPDAGAQRYLDSREDETRRDRQPNTGDQDRLDERLRDRGEERELVGGEDRLDRKADRDLTREEDREGDREAEKEDKDAERDAEKDDKDTERDVERAIDSDDVESDRDTERQIQQEDEQNAPTDD